MISIIIPTLNEESVIGETVHALKSKLTIPHEIIVSDGKSRDKTVEIARNNGAVVVEYKAEKRQTIAQGRNDGAKVAQGEYLVFFDADSKIMDPDAFFNHAISHFEKDPKLVALTVRLKVLPEMETLADNIVFGIMAFNLRIMNNVFHRGESPGEFQMMRKTIFEQLHGFREDLVTREDADMFLRLSKEGRTMFDPHLTVFHTGRRAHKIGWPKLLTEWMTNVVWVGLFNTAKTKEWKEVR